MIETLDRVLRAPLLARVQGLTSEIQVRFQHPDEAWRTTVASLEVGGRPAMALNVYLAEMRQNRDRRSTMRTRSVRDGVIVEELAPSWVDCHYLVSAWSPTATEQVEPTPDEHALLYRTVAALHDAGPPNPSRSRPAGSPALDAVPEAISDLDLPTTLMLLFLRELPVGVFARPEDYRLRAAMTGFEDVVTGVDWRNPAHDLAFATVTG